ncbi:MAG: hypothetical protein ACLFQ6_11835 [Candidatus Sumerlaeia bacterium]
MVKKDDGPKKRYFMEQMHVGEIVRVLRVEVLNRLLVFFAIGTLLIFLNTFSVSGVWLNMLLLFTGLYFSIFFGRFLFSHKFREKVSRPELDWPICYYPFIGLFIVSLVFLVLIVIEIINAA